MPATWLKSLAWFAIGIAFVSAALVLFDMYGRGYRQKMRVMEAVWPLTALYFGPLAVWGYWRFGRPQSQRWLSDKRRDEPPDKPVWAAYA